MYRVFRGQCVAWSGCQVGSWEEGIEWPGGTRVINGPGTGCPGCAGESFLAWACTPGAAEWARLGGQAGWARPGRQGWVGQARWVRLGGQGWVVKALGWVGKAGWARLGGQGWVTPAYTLLLCCAVQGCLQFFFVTRFHCALDFTIFHIGDLMC